jgi:tetratricopeptide (TPR) repeat protein
MTSREDLPLVYRLCNAGVAVLAYFGKFVFPIKLTILYPHPGTGVSVPWAVLSLGVVTLVTWYALRNLQKRPYVAVGWAWFLVSLLPVLGIVQVGAQAMADRYVYLPSIGLYVAGVWGLAEWAKRYGPGERWVLPVAALGLVGLSSVTYRQTGFWKDSRTLFTRALQCDERNPLAHNLLGGLDISDGKLDLAAAHFQRAIALAPKDAGGYLGAGDVLGTLGKRREALPYYQRACEVDPGHTKARLQWAVTLVECGRLEAAKRPLLFLLETTPKRNSPGPAEGHVLLGRIAELEGFFALAEDHYRQAGRFPWTNPELIHLLHSIKIAAGRTETPER